ncbi:MAG: hypothetical protein EXR71_01525 [Myxococcales bacterium]|nr:hypothetical protein [Myxococcales bacterium]
MRIFFALTLGACIADPLKQDTSAADTAPTISIVSPTDGDSIAYDASAVATATLTDDHPADAVTVVWTLDGAELCAGTAGADGSSSCAFRPSLGTHVMVATATDAAGGVATDTATFYAETQFAALGVILAPADADILDVGIAADFQATVAGMAPLLVSWSSDRDGLLEQLTQPSVGTSEHSFTLSGGAHTITLSVTDRYSATSSDSIELYVNQLPGTPTVRINSVSPKSFDALVATASATDPDDDALTLAYTWTVDGVEWGTGPTVPEGVIWKGEEWVVSVTANDGRLVGWDDIAVATVVNTRPEIDSVTINGSGPYECVVSASDHDGDTLTFAYSWTASGSSAGSEATLSETHPRGTLLVCEATANDGDEDSRDQSGSLVIENHLPTIDSLTIGPDPAVAGDTVSASASASDLDGDGVTVLFSWTLNGSGAGSGSSLSSAVVHGDVVEVTALAQDGSGTGAGATASLIISNTPPTASASVSPTPARAGIDALQCTASAADEDGEPLTRILSWEENGVAWTGATSSTAYADDTIAAADLVAGDAWTCLVTASDGTDTTTASSATLTISP